MRLAERTNKLAKFGVAALIAAGAATFVPPGGFAQTQDAQPSVADAARAAAAAKKDKEKSSAPKAVITEDSLGSGAVSSKAGSGGATAPGTGTVAAAPVASGDAPSGGEENVTAAACNVHDAQGKESFLFVLFLELVSDEIVE